MPKQGSLITVGAIVGLGWLLIAFAIDPPKGAIYESILIETLFGTIFGQVSLAATWTALGPFSLATRLPLSVAWIAALVISLGFFFARLGPAEGLLVMLLIFGATFVGLWVLVQTPLWLAVAFYGVKIRHREVMQSGFDYRDHQFGIRQVMLLTFIVGVVMGVGRWLVGSLTQDKFVTNVSGFSTFCFIVLCHALIALPLVTAALLPTRMPIGVCLALLMVAVETWLEIPLYHFIEGSKRGSPEDSMLWIVSGVQALWILGIVFLLRAGGFGLVVRGTGRERIATTAG